MWYLFPILENLDHVSHEIRILRVYGQAVESRDYPGPHYEGEVFQVSESEYRCPEWAHKYALHHRIRTTGNQVSIDLNQMEEVFSDHRGQGYIPGATLCSEWKGLIKEAEIIVMSEEFDIVLCTCNEAASRRITKNLRELQDENLSETQATRVLQCIVDESGMAYEPETIVPMSLCEHVILLGDHKQLQPVIQYKPARENGLTTSLFERYAKSGKNIKMLDIQYRMVKFWLLKNYYIYSTFTELLLYKMSWNSIKELVLGRLTT